MESLSLVVLHDDEEGNTTVLERVDFTYHLNLKTEVYENMNASLVEIGGVKNDSFKDIGYDKSMSLYNSMLRYAQTCHASAGYENLTGEGLTIFVISPEMADNIENQQDPAIFDKYKKFGFVSALPADKQNPESIPVLEKKKFVFSENEMISNTLENISNATNPETPKDKVSRVSKLKI